MTGKIYKITFINLYTGKTETRTVNGVGLTEFYQDHELITRINIVSVVNIDQVIENKKRSHAEREIVRS